MSRPPERSPQSCSPYTYKNNSPDGSTCSGNFRSPIFSPLNAARNGSSEFPGSSPIKRNFGRWNNHRNSGNRRFYYQNDHSKFHFSPGGNRRGSGHFRGGGSHRGSPRSNTADISLYVNSSMLNDPWKELSERLETRMKKVTPRQSTESIDSTPNHSQNTSINTSASNNEVKEELTEESLIISDSSVDLSEQTGEQ